MRFTAAISTRQAAGEAVKDLIGQIKAEGEDDSPDLALLFLSPHHRLAVADIVAGLRTALQPGLLLGCTGEGVIGRGHEIEHEPAISLVAAHLPQVELAPFSLQSMAWDSLLSDPAVFRHHLAVPDRPKLFIVLADPFTTPMEAVLGAFNQAFPGVPLSGGMASGSARAGGNALILNEQVLNNGGVGVALAGPVDIDVVVSQGCRPIGQPHTVTQAEGNTLLGLDGIPPLLHLQNLLQELPDEDRDLLRRGLFVGRAIDSDQATLGRGDFLIRGVMGVDQENGALVIGDTISDGERIQFHVRDAATAAEDLEMMLAPQLFFDPPAGGFLFSCNGRGTRLYERPDGDITTIQNIIGKIDLAGFFCAGEIGPIGRQNFLHGHTASMVLFRPSDD